MAICMKPSTFTRWCLVLLLAAPLVAFAEDRGSLLGCWRSQHVQVTLKDNTHRDRNGDCVLEYDMTHARSRCQYGSKRTESIQSYEIVKKGRLRLVSLDPDTLQPKGPPAEVDYRIDDDWLMLERKFTAEEQALSGTRADVRLRSLSVRVRAGQDGAVACNPRGEVPIRTGQSPASSLVLTTPSGWEPLLVDPTKDPRLGPAVNTSLFVGAFVPKGTAASGAMPRLLVLVVDDVRQGPRPIRQAEFAAVKASFRQDLGTPQITCDRPDRICGLIRLPEGGNVYTELFNVKGRVAMVTSSAAGTPSEVAPLLRASVTTFVDRLGQDNPK